MLRAADHRLLQNGARLHATTPRRPDHPTQVGLVRHHAFICSAMLRTRTQLFRLQQPSHQRGLSAHHRRRRRQLQLSQSRL